MPTRPKRRSCHGGGGWPTSSPYWRWRTSEIVAIDIVLPLNTRS
jgi:hypothetical protein